ncbi:MAG: HD domain-containing phosphohydrolase [Dokdonella sp.]
MNMKAESRGDQRQSTDKADSRSISELAGLSAALNENERPGESFSPTRCRYDPDACSQAYDRFAEALAAAIDLREHGTGQHSLRVACHTLVLARCFISDPACLRDIYYGALLHDIGKIGVPDAVLLKQGPLDQAEWTLMRTHPEAGRRILAHLPVFAAAAQIVLCHEEHYDGSGYPSGLGTNNIPLGARLFAVIDTLDAMTTDRPYRRGVNFDMAKAEIQRMSGSQFDPLAVEAFLQEESTLREMVARKCSVAPLPWRDIDNHSFCQGDSHGHA